jgi:hypothetical protein
MNLKELDEFRLDDAIRFHENLNPTLFNGEKLDPAVRQQLLTIAEDFMEELGISKLKVKDIVIVGSNVAYTYTRHSDIDLHVLADLSKLDDDEIYQELFTAKKTVYNDSHDIKVKGYDVELYIQNASQPIKTLGEYSIQNDKWNKFPSKRRANFDEHSTQEKFKKLIQLSELALRDDSLERIENLLATIRKYRASGLAVNGEFGPENLAYKALRSQGIVQQLYDHRDSLHSKELSLDETFDEKYGNQEPVGPESPPQMPAGTVKVKVSDVYDWYKLGQGISDLDDIDPNKFGQGAPETILSFGSEDLEHKYIKQLQNLNLKTTDIDESANVFLRPGMLRGSYSDVQLKSLGFKRASNGSWYISRALWDRLVQSKQISEASGYIPSEGEKKDWRWKTALTVDVKPDSIKKNADQLALGKIKRSGIPPTARSNGKF